MAFPLVSEICTAIRAELRDSEVSGGDINTDAKLIPHIASAASVLWQCGAGIGGPRIIRIRYLVLLANQTMIDVAGTVGSASAILADMTDPLYIGIRSNITQYTIANATQGATGLEITTSADHGRTTGDLVTLANLTKATSIPIGGDGMYGITVTGATTFTALGAYARGLGAGAYDTGADTGRAVYSASGFSRLERARDIHDQYQSNYYTWDEDRLLFHPVAEDRQVRVVYGSSATVPDETTDTIAWPDSKNFLAVLAAAYATTVNLPTVSEKLLRRALGPSGEPDASGGLLRSLLLPHVKAMQRMPASQRQRPPYQDPLFHLSNQIII